MPWRDIFFYALDTATFSSIWYWLALVVTWAAASHWVLGVPYDILLFSRRYGAQAAEDLEKMVEINTRRIVTMMDWFGMWVVAAVAFTLSALALIGFLYRLEFAQGIFMLSFPLIFVGMINLSAARKLQAQMLTGKALWRRLFFLRVWIQGIAAISIFVTASYGMYFNISAPVGY
ncbi:component of SufBCD complex [Yoonia sp. BS5-3]|uniref:Component of SufBCD complex n=1 Tax=Yoonia phaeophyticola TaxID=3137369 RepID=A0ABZ2V1G6_9RHOB